MPEHNPGNLGGTMRLGIRRTVFKTENSILSKFPMLFILQDVGCCSCDCSDSQMNFQVGGQLCISEAYFSVPWQPQCGEMACHLLFADLSTPRKVNPKLINQFEQNDLSFVGQDVDGDRMEIIELASKWALHF
ncbi:PREDICTED: CTP synthase 2-like [Rhinopithecus bieti]|uniref:CTP synthase 2-like n=1 Tax=Rhinopithecus bieti TaxID=61621 RepID=UPI00083BBF6A|nr:PREDICTED: CTP synthase 2-like [Rhinopithecus bieti]